MEIIKESKRGNYEKVKALIENKAELETKDKTERTALNNASLEGHKEVVKLLIENKAELETKDNSGRTPILCIIEN